MSNRNPESPWNPAEPASLTPKEYEQQVVAWLRTAAQSLEGFAIQHLKRLTGPSGDFEFDAVAELTLFGGARVVVLVECKRWSRAVEREDLLALWAKLQDVGAHKAMVFATCGFQSGALAYARSRGIATITFVEGTFLYETRGLGRTLAPPPWANLPAFAGILVSSEGTTIHSARVDHGHVEALRNWLGASRSGV